MLRPIILGLLVWLGTNLSAQQKFPEIACVNLKGEKLTLPRTDKHQVIIMAFGRHNEKELESWLQPAFDKFVLKTGLIDLMFDAHLYLVSVLSGVEATTAKANLNKIKDQIDADLYSNILMLNSDADIIMQTLKPDTRQVHVYLLNKEGDILRVVKGKFDDDKMEALEDAFEDS